MCSRNGSLTAVSSSTINSKEKGHCTFKEDRSLWGGGAMALLKAKADYLSIFLSKIEKMGRYRMVDGRIMCKFKGILLVYA